jgi:hypothetical protein
MYPAPGYDLLEKYKNISKYKKRIFVPSTTVDVLLVYSATKSHLALL